MDFTREPVIESVITPREGCKLVVRSSKGGSQEEYFVDAVEMVSFGSSLFYRSLEKPKCFLLPVSDYEILEVREARMVLKHVGSDRSIKIGGGKKEKGQKDSENEKDVKEMVKEDPQKMQKKKERRRPQRRRKSSQKTDEHNPEKVELPAPSENVTESGEGNESASSIIRSLLNSPPPLISETINQYRESYGQAFFDTEEEEEEAEENESYSVDQQETSPITEESPDEAEEEATIVSEDDHQKRSLWDFSD